MPHAVTSTSDGKSYSYDCNGNMLADGERTFTWDADNKPVSITRTGLGTTTFSYTGDGGRVKKQGLTQLIRYASGFEDHATDAVQVKHITVGGLRIATRVVGGPNAGTYFTHGDHLGSLNVLTNSTGTEVQRLTYLPFGETDTNTGAVDFHQRRYTGQEQDPETGLYFYNARYYNPVLGRFLSPDSIIPGAGNPQSLNRYSYVNNNPVNFTDPTGHFLFFLPMLVGAVIGYAAAELTTVAIIGGIIGGAAAGAASTAIYGGNPARNVLVGALLGGLGAAVGPPLAGALAGPLGSEAAGAVASATVTGAVVGGVGAAIYGGNVLEGILAGAITAAAFAVATQAAVQLAQRIESPALDTSKMYAQAGASDVADTSAADIRLLHRLTFAAGASDYNTPNAMEAIASSVTNRVGSSGFPDTLEGVVFQPGQYAEVGDKLWRAWANPGALTPGNAAAYARALTVARGVYLGTIPDPTGGAMWFHVVKNPSEWFAIAVRDGRIQWYMDIGRHSFYGPPR